VTVLAEALAEEWPTGTFGGPRPTTPVRTPTSPELAASHRAELEAELKRARHAA
jgi:hypothetical protein